jgi:hypothetical protein
MKNKLKYLIAAALALSILAGGAVSSYADEATPDNASGEISDGGYGAQSEGEATDGYGRENGATDEENGGDNAAKSDTGTEEEAVTFFARVYEELANYASEILCALTLAGSVTLAVAYKKGLIPLLEGSLVAIGNAITKIKESTKESADASTMHSEKTQRLLTEASGAIDTLTRKIEGLAKALDDELKAKSADRGDRERLTAVVNEQIAMLYDIFMSVELPQYQKDAVGERVAKMKEALRENGYEN